LHALDDPTRAEPPVGPKAILAARLDELERRIDAFRSDVNGWFGNVPKSLDEKAPRDVTEVPFDSVVTASHRSMAGQLGVGSGFWGIPTVYWKSHGGRLFDRENLSDAQQKELELLENRIAIQSRAIVDLNSALADVKAQVDLPQAVGNRFDALEKLWNDSIAEAREKKSTILGDAISLSSTQGKPESQFEIRMRLRLRHATRFNVAEFRVAYARNALSYTAWRNGPSADTSLSVDLEDDPADPAKRVLRVVFTNIGQAD
jgi:uncharacterized coiled-coil protein SlyX